MNFEKPARTDLGQDFYVAFLLFIWRVTEDFALKIIKFLIIFKYIHNISQIKTETVFGSEVR